MKASDIWEEFITELRSGVFPVDRIVPYPELEHLTDKIGNILRHLTPTLLSAADNRIDPDIYIVKDQIHFILPLETNQFCFSFLVVRNQWFIQHVENIFIRLDQIEPPPVSTFPDLTEAQKAWARDEIQISEMVRLFNFLKAEKGIEFALNWFKDGSGYFSGARAWVPFVPPSEAFILYVCWDLANLHGNPITLHQLDENNAKISGELRFFEIYQRAAHLSPVISAEDYQQLFETIWRDRAECAGWNLQIAVDGTEVKLVFTK